MRARKVNEILFKPKSEEEILYSMDNLDSFDNLLIKSTEIRFLPGVKRALERGANVHARGDLALRKASYNNHFEIVKFLIDNGADIHINGDEPLRYASYKGNYDIVKLLLENGADVHADNDDALRLALQYGHHDVVKLLKKYM